MCADLGHEGLNSRTTKKELVRLCISFIISINIVRNLYYIDVDRRLTKIELIVFGVI